MRTPTAVASIVLACVLGTAVGISLERVLAKPRSAALAAATANTICLLGDAGTAVMCCSSNRGR